MKRGESNYTLPTVWNWQLIGCVPRISPDLSSIPNFRLLGDPTQPTILSNKIILTPPAPGNQRGAIWGDQTLQQAGWTADIDFRATGPERGGGMLTVWLARNGQYEIGTSSIYTVGKFEGLALNIDTYAGTVWSSLGYFRGSTNICRRARFVVS